jgi:hypothetical protein
MEVTCMNNVIALKKPQTKRRSSLEKAAEMARHPSAGQRTCPTVLLEGRYATVEDYAVYVGKSPATVKRWCAKVFEFEGAGRVTKVGRVWLIRWTS